MENLWYLVVGVGPSVLDLLSAVSLMCTRKGICYTDAQWRSIALSYASPAFWAEAAARPSSGSHPLHSWRAELQRLVIFDIVCIRADSRKMCLEEYRLMWAVRDRTCSERPERRGSPQPAPDQTVVHIRELHSKCAESAMACVVSQPEAQAQASQAVFSVSPAVADTERTSPRRVRAKLDPTLENGYAQWLTLSSDYESVDYLAQLYPHVRDADCWMDEINHKYHVLGEIYPCSVSGVWKVFFPVFDPCFADMSIRSAETKGLKGIASSAYNLVHYLRLHERLDPFDSTFWSRVQEVLSEAERYYKIANWTQTWEKEEVVEAVRSVTMQTGMGTKPPGKVICYFLTLCAGCTAEELRQVWRTGGELESFKGTYLHKQAELFMQELAAWQCEKGVSHVPLSKLLESTEILQRARAACSPERTMSALIPHVSAQLWDLPPTQAFFSEQRATRRSPEYLRFEAWLRANSSLSPYRSEWSIYNEDYRVAGQVDSLWFDTARNNEVTMADWKRAKKLLTADPSDQRKQCYGKSGLRTCSKAPGVIGPCADMMDCSHSHYSAQQHLYAFFLKEKYDVDVRKLSLVQCHPDIGETDSDYHEAVLEMIPGFAAQLLQAFEAGWKTLL